ncbi:hypothetical protein A2U01_0029072, partial [Trifolium medium]|nr:hypothetical protein [Trifolium medium]
MDSMGRRTLTEGLDDESEEDENVDNEYTIEEEQEEDGILNNEGCRWSALFEGLNMLKVQACD